MKDIVNQLKVFGLDEVECHIYLQLHEDGELTPLELSRLLSVSRTTIYDKLEHLTEIGLVEKVIQHKSQSYKATPVSHFSLLIKKQEEEIAHLTQAFDYLKVHLPETAPSPLKTQVRYYHGKEGIQQMMWNSLKADASHIGYSSLGRQEIVGESFLREWTLEVINRGIKDRVIVTRKPATLQYIDDTNELNALRKKYVTIKTLPEGLFYISGDITIYNNVYALQYWQQGELVGVELENQEFITTQKSIFELLWQMAKPLT